jgi:hypothetical protein
MGRVLDVSCGKLPTLNEAGGLDAPSGIGGPVGLVLADAEFDSERNHRHVRGVIGADSSIPAKRSKADWKIKGVQARYCSPYYQSNP